MLQAFGWGLLAGSSYFLGGLLALRWRVGNSVLLGILTGLGAGALLSAVAYKLVAEAGRLAGGSGYVGVGLIGGAVATAWVVTGAVRGRRLSEPPVHEPRFLVIGLSVVAEAVVITGALLSGYGISALAATTPGRSRPTPNTSRNLPENGVPGCTARCWPVRPLRPEFPESSFPRPATLWLERD